MFPVDIVAMNCDMSSRRMQRKSMRVQFAPETQTIVVPSRKDIPGEEAQQLWYRHKDLAKISMRNICIAKKLKVYHDLVSETAGYQDAALPCLPDDMEERLLSGHCTRGIEHVCSASLYQNRTLRKLRVCVAVYHEQILQRVIRIHDPDRIAEVARKQTQLSVVMAYAIGQLDEKAAARCSEDISGSTSFSQSRESDKGRRLCGEEPESKRVRLR